MKTICLIRDERPFWEEIAVYLKTVNAKILVLYNISFLQGLSGKDQDLIIGSIRIYKKLISIPQDIPKLIITDGTFPEGKSGNNYFINWPISKDTFLEVTSKLLSVSERRIFKTIISIIRKGDVKTSMGQSFDFSMSGMSFKADGTFNTGDILKLGFFLPNFNERLSFDVEVIRSCFDPADASIHYGARFLNIEGKIKDAIEVFIKKIKT